MARSHRQAKADIDSIEWKDHDSKPDGWKRAYLHAAQTNTSEKARVNYADAHLQDNEFNPEDDGGETS